MSDASQIPEPPDREAAKSRDERRIRAAQDVLRTTIRDIYFSHFGVVSNPSSPVSLHLSVRIDASFDWKTEFDPPLHGQIASQFAHFEAARDVFSAGHVYCFRCASSACDHSVPPTSLHVFSGFDATGRPEWKEFTQVLLDEKDERVDQLYLKPPRLLAAYQAGKALKGRQLAAFGKASLSYSVLGQVVAGYLRNGEQRTAVTLQVVEGRTRDGDLQLRLNPISSAVDGGFLVEWLSSEQSASLFRAIQIAERELHRVEELARAARQAHDQERANQMMGRIPAIMRRLGENIERGGRQGERRTFHAESRRQEQRPVHKALDDARAASLASCYYDEKSKTFIVVGDRGRTHAFSRNGRHVTSFTTKPSAIAMRLRTRRWRPAEISEWDEVRRSIGSRTERTVVQEEEA